MKVSQKTFGLIFSTVICLVMSLVMSFVVIVMNMGFVEDFFTVWITSIGAEFIVALPLSIIAIPMIQKLLQKYFIIKV